MKRFHFTLQALLTVRQRGEHIATERYAAALLARQRAAEALASLESEIRRANDALRAHMAQGSRAADLAQRQDHFQVLDARRGQADQALQSASQVVGSALEQMIEARRQREVVEKCRGKQWARHQREQLRQEDRTLDELALRRFAPSLVWRGNE